MNKRLSYGLVNMPIRTFFGKILNIIKIQPTKGDLCRPCEGRTPWSKRDRTSVVRDIVPVAVVVSYGYNRVVTASLAVVTSSQAARAAAATVYPAVFGMLMPN